MIRILHDFRAALMLLTRLPVWKVRDERAPDLSRSVWAYPLVGLLVGEPLETSEGVC